MKKLPVILIGFFATLSGFAEMESIGGWHAIGSDLSYFVSNAAPEALAEPMALLEGGSSVLPEMEITESIHAQAAALDNDPVKIFEFVRNRIGFELYYGCFKGAEGTLLSGYGNDLDQCTLLGALLKAADDAIAVSYKKGNVVYTAGFLTDLIGCSTNYLPNLYPYFLNSAPIQRADGWEFQNHYWLQVTIDGTTYQLDPSFVPHEAAPADAEAVLAEVTGYTRTNLLSAASNGATAFTTEQVQSVNATAVENLLRSYVAELHQAKDSGDSDVAQLVGQRQPEWQPIAALNTNIPPDMVRVASSSVLSSLSDTMFARYELTHPSGFSAVSLKGYDLAGKRLTLFYDQSNGNRPVLRLNGEEQARGTNNLSLGSSYKFAMRVFLPAAWGVYQAPAPGQTITCDLTVGYSYNVVCDLLTASPKILAQQSRKLAAYRAQGLADSSEEVLGTTLNLMGLFYCRQNILQVKLLSRTTGIPAAQLYQAGVVAQEAGYYIDLPLCGISYITQMPNAAALFQAGSFMASGLEHGMLEQIMGPEHPGISTTKGIALNNAAGKHTYYATSANWTSGLNVRSLLVGYTTAQKSTLDSYINGGYNLLVPRYTVSVGEWTGITFFGIHPQALGAIISGSYGTQNGGYSGYRGYVPPPVVNTVTRTTYIPPPPPPVQIYRPKSIEPVDLYSGAYLFDHMDLSMSGPLPLTLNRHYNSGQTAASGIMGSGWCHSLQIAIDEHSSGDFAFGERDTADAAAVLAAQMIALDLMRNENNAKGWTTAAIAAKWALDSAVENTLTVRIGESGRQFTRLPDGGFNPPAGSTDELIQTNGVYVLQERNANTYTFNTNNLIAQIADSDGNTLAFSYNAQTNLQTVTSSFGPSLTFSYTGDLLTSVSDNSSPTRTIQYQYGSSDNLTNFVDVAGESWAIAYGDTNYPSAITVLTDPEGITTIQNAYNTLGVVTQQVSATSNLWNFYTSDAQSIEEDPFGRKTTYQFDAKGRTVRTQRADGSNARSEYNGRDQITNTVNAAGVTSLFVYDNNLNLIEKQEAIGTPEERVSYYSYDTTNKLICISNQVSATEWQDSRFEYDSEHHVTKITDALGHETLFEYWPDGQLKKRIEDGGRVTDYAYDTAGNPDTVTSTDAGTVDLDYNTRGELIKQKDAKNAETQFIYDNRGLLLKTLYPDGSSVSNSYNGAGLLIAQKDARSNTVTIAYTPAYKVKTVTLPDGGTISNAYDAADRLIATKNTKNQTASYALDEIGRIVSVSSAYSVVENSYDASGNVTNSAVDPSGLNLWTAAGYDSLNRPLNQQSPIANQQFQYDLLGRQTNSIDAAGYEWGSEYDVLGRKTENLRPSGVTEQFVYDALGNRIGFYNAEGKPITFGFDAQGRVTAITNAIGKVTAFAYDNNGNIISREDAKAQSTGYEYDSMSRLTNVVNQGLSKASVTYDANGNLLSHRDNEGNEVEFGYDEMNRMARSEVSLSSLSSFAVTNSYDLNGNRTNIVYPGGLNVSYTYDAEDRLASVTAKNAQITNNFSFGYDGANRLTNMGYPNGVSSLFGYDVESRVTNYTHGAFINRTIQRDPRGFKTSENITAGLGPAFPEGEQRFTNTDADQTVFIAQRDTWLGGELNQWYNRIYDYDDNGCLTQETVFREYWNTNSSIDEYRNDYTWDYDNRLTGTEKTVLIGSNVTIIAGIVDRTWTDGPSVSTEYLYDASGVRIGRIHNAVTNYFVIDYTAPLKMPLAETDAEGNITRYYIWSSHGLLAHFDVTDNGSQITVNSVRYYHADEQGSTLAITDESGAVTDEFAYTPYGKCTARTGATVTPFQWLGGYGVYYDSTANLHLTLHRAYSADMRRWLSADPLGIDGFENLYVYGDVNPVNFIDPTGEVAWVGAVGGGIGGFASDILLQAGMNMLAGNEWNEDLDWGSAWTSAGVGAVAGATGMGAITQGKNAVKSFKVFNQARKNVNAREIAIAAGKFRNPTKTAMQIAQRNMALKQTAQSLAFGSSGPILKRSLKELAPSNLPESTQPTSKFINTYQPKIGK
jgi:RHS repeat-associated protein